MICYLSRNYRGVDNAGNKAKTDIEQIMESHGFRNVGLKQTRYRNVVVAFCCTLFSVLKSILCLRKGDAGTAISFEEILCICLQYGSSTWLQGGDVDS